MENSFKRILLIEDNHLDVEMILSALKEYNLSNEVAVVDDGEEALDYLHQRGRYLMREKGNPIVILLDIKLPKMSGVDVLNHIKTEKTLNCIPVVILTSSKEEQDIDICYKAGANAYVVKPVDFHDFVETVKQLGMFWALVNEPSPHQK